MVFLFRFSSSDSRTSSSSVRALSLSPSSLTFALTGSSCPSGGAGGASDPGCSDPASPPPRAAATAPGSKSSPGAPLGAAGAAGGAGGALAGGASGAGALSAAGAAGLGGAALLGGEGAGAGAFSGAGGLAGAAPLSSALTKSLKFNIGYLMTTKEVEELELYSSAKELSKKKLLDGLAAQISDPGFDIINFARLLEQDDGGENGLNPLHSVFTQNTVQQAKKFLRAVELLDEYFASLPEATDDAPADNGEIVAEFTDEE